MVYGLAFAAVNGSSLAAKAPELPPLNRFPRMVHNYFIEQARRIEAKADERRASLKNRQDAERYVAEVRQKIQQCFGPWPEKTPLNPRITGTVERDTYRIENIIFESRPGFQVTANLYVPKNGPFPRPGVVGTCGHSHDGKAAESYQSFAQALCRLGYVVLIYDPIGQGERLQYPDDKLKSTIGGGVREHLYAGNQQFLVGDFLGSWRAWDGIRALDYLLTRKEVDPKQVGVTGNSGGGTMTTWLCGVEYRWSMAAPSCFVTSFLHNLKNELPADTEQCPPRALALGLDHSDFLAAQAPNPVIILAKERDFFDVRGSQIAHQRLRSLYGLLGAEKEVELFVGPTPHGYSQENREAMYRWFNRATQVSTATTEPELIIEKNQTLWAAPQGQVAMLKSRTVFDFTRDKSIALGKKRAPISSATSLRKALIDVLRLNEANGSSRPAPDYRILRSHSYGARKFPKSDWTTYMVDTEPGIQSVVYRLNDEDHQSRPPQGVKKAILYVSHQSSDVELRKDSMLKQLIHENPEAAFYSCDVRGIGESRPNTCAQNAYLNPYGSDYFYAIHSIMLNRPYVGRRTLDVLRVIDWLKATGHSEVHLVAAGWGSIPATFAAVLAEPVKQVTLKNALTSYSAIAESKTYNWPLSSLVPGILQHFDLPDCYALLKRTKKLHLIEPWDENGKTVEHDHVSPPTHPSPPTR